MDELIIQAMTAVGQEHPHFGLTRKGNRQATDLEDAFQKRLTEALTRVLRRSEGWEWYRERCFNTEALVNRRGINVDIIGLHQGNLKVAVELKYVTATYSDNWAGKPSDEPAFPYDVAWDCLKLELLLGGKAVCQPDKPLEIRPYVIALTNWPDFWQGRSEGRRPYGGWSKNSWKRLIVANGAGPDQGDAIVFDEPIESAGRNPDRTIFGAGGERCHVAFGLTWRGMWHEYGTPECARQCSPSPVPYCRFRYLLLRPDVVRQPCWNRWYALTPEDRSKTVPFLTKDAREDYWRKARKVRGLHVPRHGPSNKSTERPTAQQETCLSSAAEKQQESRQTLP